jgi:hypothetical protein
MKINEQTDSLVGQTKVREQLRDMNRSKLIDSFDLNHY